MWDRQDKLRIAIALAASVGLHGYVLSDVSRWLGDAAVDVAVSGESDGSAGQLREAEAIELPEPERIEKEPDDKPKANQPDKPEPQQEAGDPEELHPERYRMGTDDGSELALAWVSYEAFEKLRAQGVADMRHEQAPTQTQVAAAEQAPARLDATAPAPEFDSATVGQPQPSAAGNERATGTGRTGQQTGAFPIEGQPTLTPGDALDGSAVGIGQGQAGQPAEGKADPTPPAQATANAKPAPADSTNQANASPAPDVSSPTVAGQPRPGGNRNPEEVVLQRRQQPLVSVSDADVRDSAADQQWGDAIDDQQETPTQQKEAHTPEPTGEAAIDQMAGRASRVDPRGQSVEQDRATPPQPVEAPVMDQGPTPAAPTERLAQQVLVDSEGQTRSDAAPTQRPRAVAPDPDTEGEPTEQLPAEAERDDPQGKPTVQEASVSPDPQPDGEAATADPSTGRQTAVVDTRKADPADKSGNQPDAEESPDTPEAPVKTDGSEQVDATTNQQIAMGEKTTPRPDPSKVDRESDRPAQDAARPARPSGATGTPAPSARPTVSPRTESEADAVGREAGPTVVRPGKVETINGVLTHTVAPRFSVIALSSAWPSNPRFRIKFNAQGKVVKVDQLSTTGYADLDGIVLATLYKWRQSGDNLEKRDGPATVTLTIVLTPE